MTIHPIDKPQSALKPSTINGPEKAPTQKFSEVLDAAVPPDRKGGPIEQQAILSIPSAAAEVCRVANPADSAVASGLLDTLEHYQHLLADPAVSLKGMAPVVQSMQRAADRAEGEMVQLPEGHPVKAVMDETVGIIRQEVIRFNSGQYVDDSKMTPPASPSS
jgi:hypothetical protein